MSPNAKPLLLCLLLLSGCTPRSPVKPATPSSRATAAPSAALFQDVATQAGIRFQHTNGASKGRFYFIESTPAGCAFLDYDNDGWLDVLLVQSGSSEPLAQVKDRPHCALYHNNHDGTFTEVTAGSGLDRDLGYAHGVAVGDYDNDGYEDLFITSYGGNHLFHNEHGSGKFTDVTHEMGLDKLHSTGYATSAAWGDYDNDGKLDLYVCYYTPWNWDRDRPCQDAKGNRDFCSPEIFDPDVHVLYHNEGGRFVDVSAKAGITKAQGRGLAVAFVDYDSDGWPDIFVANDLTPNMLWRNNRNGTFTNVALEAGCSHSENGNIMAAMGVSVADYDHSGRESLFVTNFSGMPNTLFKNLDGRVFQDVSMQSGVALPHMSYLSFGCEFMDYDADGWADLMIANGHVQVSAGSKLGVTYAERKQLMHNERNGTFRDIASPSELGDLSTPLVARGLAVGDFDNDGRLDALFNNQNGPAQLFHNLDHSSNHWVSFKTVGTRSNRDGILARFTLQAGGMRQMATVRGGSSYLSSSDRRVYFGLGTATKIEEVEIRWPSGAKEVLKNVDVDTFYTVTEGRGMAVKDTAASTRGKDTIR